MAIAYTMKAGRGDADLLMAAVAEAIVARGLRPCGIVQINTEVPGGGPCDMDVKLLPEGPAVRISQSLGPESRGCRLDVGALEQAVGLAQARLDAGADVMIVNKFGKHEADGRGFRPLIAEALLRGVPVLVGVNAVNEKAFLAFTEGMAEKLAPEAAVLEAWIETEAAAARAA